MFKKADDVKSNLILTALSYLDFYKPTYAFFENVPGFVNFHLQADRANLHGAKGEIEKGGLKIFIRGLIDMKYGHLANFAVVNGLIDHIFLLATKFVSASSRQHITERLNVVSVSSSLRPRQATSCPNFLSRLTTTRKQKIMLLNTMTANK